MNYPKTHFKERSMRHEIINRELWIEKVRETVYLKPALEQSTNDNDERVAVI